MEPLAEVRRLVLEAVRGHDVVVRLFGSWATGRPSRVSDVDVAIESRSALPPGALASLREALEESSVPYRVDVVDLAAASPAFCERVRREGVVWTD